MVYVCFSEPIPRKGTETLRIAASPLETYLGAVFQNLFPARGRKQRQLTTATIWCITFFRTYSPQGDGNIVDVVDHRAAVYLKFFRTYSPQGDGNKLSLIPLAL